MASSSTAPQPTTTASEVSIENQSTFLLWFHNCFIGCPSHWHDTPSSPSTTYILATFETDFFANTSILNAKDIKIWRLDLLTNSDGDATKRSKHQGDVLAEEEFVEKWLNTLERECEKLFDDFASPRNVYNPNDNRAQASRQRQGGTYIWSNPTDTLQSFPPGYALMHRPRDDDPHREGDVYLWGHPSGRSYVSVSKFVVHLKWLVEGKNGECECVLCKPPPPRPKKEKGELEDGNKGKEPEGKKGKEAEGKKGKEAEGKKGKEAEGKKGKEAEGKRGRATSTRQIKA